MTNSDMQLRQHVEEELTSEPILDAASIGVTVREVVVGLSGEVDTYAQKQAAAEIVSRIRGVRAVANDIEVKLPMGTGRTDEELAHAIASVFFWNTSIPKNQVRVLVSQGWVTLEGSVAWQYQKAAAENAVKDLMGVRGITNLLVVQPISQKRWSNADFEHKLKHGAASVQADWIVIETEGDTVILSGAVPTLAMRSELERQVWRAPGITDVKNGLQVEPLMEVVEFV